MTDSPPPSHPARRDEADLMRECQIRRGRRSGPGGQHRNKVETAIVITHQPTGVTGEATERRSQEQNRQMAVFRLRVNLALGVRSSDELGRGEQDPRPSDLWQSRCVGGRVAINPEHADFPALLAEALDVITRADYDVKRAAERLGCTSSQLLKLLRQENRALELVNNAREQRGLRRLN